MASRPSGAPPPAPINRELRRKRPNFRHKSNHLRSLSLRSAGVPFHTQVVVTPTEGWGCVHVGVWLPIDHTRENHQLALQPHALSGSSARPRVPRLSPGARTGRISRSRGRQLRRDLRAYIPGSGDPGCIRHCEMAWCSTGHDPFRVHTRVHTFAASTGDALRHVATCMPPE